MLIINYGAVFFTSKLRISMFRNSHSHCKCPWLNICVFFVCLFANSFPGAVQEEDIENECVMNSSIKCYVIQQKLIVYVTNATAKTTIKFSFPFCIVIFFFHSHSTIKCSSPKIVAKAMSCMRLWLAWFAYSFTHTQKQQWTIEMCITMSVVSHHRTQASDSMWSTAKNIHLLTSFEKNYTAKEK